MTDVDQLRRQIEKLTGRAVVSRDLNYLTQRLAALKKKKESGDRMPNAKRADRASVVSVSLTKRRVELLARICKARKEGVSVIIRDAFDAWASKNGYETEILNITVDEADIQ